MAQEHMESVSELLILLTKTSRQRRELSSAFTAWHDVAVRAVRDRQNEFGLDLLWLRRRYSVPESVDDFFARAASLEAEHHAAFHREFATLIQNHRVRLLVTIPCNTVTIDSVTQL